MIKLEALLAAVAFVLWVFCIVDVIQSREGAIRHLTKTIWLLLVLFFPLVGSIAWLTVGRPQGGPRRLSAHEREAPAFPEYDRPGRAAAASAEADDEFLRRVRERAEAQRRAFEEKHRRQAREG